MRRHFTLDSLTSVPSKKADGSISKPGISRKTERHDISPSELVIRNILNYSLALAVIPTQETGNVKMLMN
jgi:hypothetical protein